MVIVDCALYEAGVRRPGELQVGECHQRVDDGKSFIWVGLFEPTEAEFGEVRAVFQLHPLAVEDALKAHQMPKLELYDESVFLVLKTARYIDEVEEVEFGEIQVFIGDGFLVHVRHGEASPLRLVRKDAEHHPELLGCGPSAVLHAITDHVVDSYEPVIAGLENDVHEVEMEVFSGEGHNPVERIYFLKREVLQVHAALSPLVPVLHQLAHRRVEFVHENMQEYFRDVYDHLVRTVDKVNQFSDMLSSVLAANLTQVGVRQNQDMRKIAAWAAILAVPTALGRRVRHELRAHARTRLAPWLSRRPGHHGARVHPDVSQVPVDRVALKRRSPGQSRVSSTVWLPVTRPLRPCARSEHVGDDARVTRPTAGSMSFATVG